MCELNIIGSQHALQQCHIFNLRFICVFRCHLILLFSLSFLLRYVLFHTFLPLAILVCVLYFLTYSSSLFFLFSKLPRGRSVEWCIHSKKRSAFTSKWCQLSCEHFPTYCCRNVLACLNDKIDNIMVIKPLPKKILHWDGGMTGKIRPTTISNN